MTSGPQSFTTYVNLLFIRDHHILLLRRAKDVRLFPGHWHGPAGKIEEGESPKQTIIREAFEEIGVKVDPFLGAVVVNKAPNFNHTELIWKEIGLFFVVKDSEEVPMRKEPHLHDAMEWFDLNHLPNPMIPVVKFGIEQYVRGEMYGEFTCL
jgi:8-oxo-dGTP pyrophosphatase MutT (NUDIX family)